MFIMLRHERPFSLLLAGNLLSQIGDGVHEFVFIIAVLKATHNNVALAGVIYFFRFIPYLVLGPLGGALSDRLSRYALMLFADLARIGVTSTFCLLLIQNQIAPFFLAIIGMSMTAFRTLFQPAFQGAIPNIVSTAHLPMANGATQMAAEIGGLIGPALGGVILSATSNLGQVLIVDAVTYLISALCVWRIAMRVDQRLVRMTGSVTLRGLYREFCQNVKSVQIKRELFVTIAYSSLCILFVSAALRILIPLMLKNASYTDSMIGYAMSITALGALTGAIVCSKVIRDFSTHSLMVYWCCYGFVLIALPLGLFSMPVILLSCFILGGFGAFVDVILPTNIQKLSTEANLGKNFSLFSTLANTSEALSGGLASIMILFSPVTLSISIIGVFVLSIAYTGRIKTVESHV